MKRRTFVQGLTAAMAGALMPPVPGSALATTRRATRLDRIGLELYAVRNAMGADPERTLAAVRAMGYTDVELLWSHRNFGRTTEQVRASLDREGLRAPSAHMAPETIVDSEEWKRSLD